MDIEPDHTSRDNRAPPAPLTIELPATAEASSLARRFIDDNRDHLAPDLIDDAKLLVSEIVTNAVQYGRSPITIALRIDPPGLGVTVTDAGDTQPQVPTENPPAAASSGRGLLIVDRLATAWGVVPTTPPPGKSVWFDL